MHAHGAFRAELLTAEAFDAVLPMDDRLAVLHRDRMRRADVLALAAADT